MINGIIRPIEKFFKICDFNYIDLFVHVLTVYDHKHIGTNYLINHQCNSNCFVKKTKNIFPNFFKFYSL